MWLLGVLIVLLALLSVPVDLSYRLHLRAGVEGRISIGWLFGLVRIPIRLGGERSKKKAEKRRKKRARKAKKAGLGDSRRVFMTAEFWRWVRRLLRRLLARIQVYGLFLRVRLGLGDPADTGLLWAWVGPLAALLANFPLADVRIEPNFMEAELVVESEGELRLYPIALIATVVATALSPSTWRLFRQQGGKR